jgi:transcription-repair coupling factor (superfamily II helicase)
LPRTGSGGVGADRVRDVALLQYIADFLLALDGRAAGAVDVSMPARV